LKQIGTYSGTFQSRVTHKANFDNVKTHWGAAYGAGPFYNNWWRQFSEHEANVCTKFSYDHIQSAREFASTATALENHLVEALAQRFQKPHVVSGDEFDRWDDDYANAMRRVYFAHKDDHDVMALFTEAIMTRTPWQLWDVKKGVPANSSDVLEALDVVERSIAMIYIFTLLKCPMSQNGLCVLLIFWQRFVLMLDI